MAHWAKPGVKCTCISDWGRWAGPEGEAPKAPPIKGRVYTIRETETRDGLLFLVLVECDPEEMFGVKNFRPVVSRTQEQDLELFQHLLVEQREDA